MLKSKKGNTITAKMGENYSIQVLTKAPNFDYQYVYHLSRTSLIKIDIKILLWMLLC